MKFKIVPTENYIRIGKDIWDRGNLYVDVDAIQQGAGDTAKVVSYLERGTAAFLLGMTIKSAGASIQHRLQTFLNHGMPNIFTFELEINLLEESGFYKTNPKTLGEYIKKARLDRKMTARELAEIIGCSKNILLDWEKDRRIPRIGHLKRINEVLEVPHEFLRGAIAKSYSLSEKEKDMLFEMDLIKENLNGCINPINKGRKIFQRLGPQLRVLRLNLFMNHRDFAKILDVDPSTVLDWENGRHEFNVKIIKKIIL